MLPLSDTVHILSYYIILVCPHIRTYVRIFVLMNIGFNSKGESLFTYNQQIDQSWESFYDPYFLPLFTVIENNTLLESICENDTFCLYDMSVTGNTEIGLSTLNGSKQYDKIVQLSYPGTYV